MRRTLVALMSCLLIGVACTPAAPAPPATPATTGSGQAPAAEQRSANQVLRIAQSSLPPNLGPECCVAQRQVFRLMFDMLVTLDDNLQPQPWAAERWEFVNPTTFRFYLRHDLTFS